MQPHVQLLLLDDGRIARLRAVFHGAAAMAEQRWTEGEQQPGQTAGEA
jgi:hypothetical protein